MTGPWNPTGFDEEEDDALTRVPPPPPMPVATTPSEEMPSQAIPTVQTAAQRAAQEMAEAFARINGGPLPQRMSPPLSPAGHAPLPTIEQQRAAIGIATVGPNQEPARTPPSVPAIPRPVVTQPAQHAAAIGIVASPDAIHAIERREPRAALSAEGREAILPLAAILCDPSRNYSRAGLPWQLDDPEVVDTAETIETVGLKNPIGVRKLDPPIERDVPIAVEVSKKTGDGEGSESEETERVLVTHYTHQLVDGFKRFAALELLKRPFSRFTEMDIAAELALLHNGIENFTHTDPTEYQEAIYLTHFARISGWSAEEVASMVKIRVSRAEALFLMVERLPHELLECFKQEPTPEMRRVLAKIARIERETKEETHQAMIDEWVRIREQRSVEREQEKEQKKRDAVLDGTGERARRSMNKPEIERFRANARRATEWYDAMRDEWIPIDETSRAFADAMLRRVCNPKGRSILR